MHVTDLSKLFTLPAHHSMVKPVIYINAFKIHTPQGLWPLKMDKPEKNPFYKISYQDFTSKQTLILVS